MTPNPGMIGTTLAGKYYIKELVGSGGMAMVYRAENLQDGSQVAVKMLRPEHLQDEQLVRRFEMETRIALSYSFKNIVKTFEVLHIDGYRYIVMEYVEGYILSDYINERGMLPIGEVVSIGRQVCNALFYAHSHRLIHRDIKPQNIMINRDGLVKVVDFGIAKAPVVPESETASMGGEALGSVHYISPEQAQGKRVDEHTDIYSMGIVLYEMATGQVPFDGDSPVQVALKQVNDTPASPRQYRGDIPPALEKIILKALQKDPDLRYDNAREMARDLERVLGEPDGAYVQMQRFGRGGGTRKIQNLGQLNLEGTAPGRNTPVPGAPARNAGERGGAGERSTPSARKGPTPWKRSPLWYAAIALVAVALLTAGGFVVRALALRSRASAQVAVPPLVGYPLEVAETYLKSANLTWQIQEVVSDAYQADHVVSQWPESGVMTDQGGIITLYVSSGPATIEVPSFYQLDYDQAAYRAKKNGLMIGEVRYMESDALEGTVVQQDPLPGVRIAPEQTIIIWLAQAKPQSDVLRMPSLVGKEKAEAIRLLSELDVQFELLVRHIESEYGKDVVAQQEPAEGSPLDGGTKVTLWLSGGSEALYTAERSFTIQVPYDGTRVTVTYVDDPAVGAESVVYNATLNRGSTTLILEFGTNVAGKKQMVLYFNGNEEQRVDFTFIP